MTLEQIIEFLNKHDLTEVFYIKDELIDKIKELWLETSGLTTN